MADIVVRAPDGSIVEIPEAQYQDALNQGYSNVEQAEAESARDEAIASAGDDAAVTAGLLEAPDDYDSGLAAREKILSGFTFGQADELQTPESRARGRKFSEENPGETMLYEGVGQLPYAIAGAAGGAAAGAAVKGASLLARGAVAAGDFGANALVGGAQIEGEESRLSGEDFSFTDAAITGAVGETLGRGAAWGIARGVGGARNLMARGSRDIVAADASDSLAKGGWVRDYQTTQHAEAYHTELADLAARDLDTLEDAFGEVSRQDRKRGRIIKTVQDNPAVQREVNIQEADRLRVLRDALAGELAEGGGPAKKLARQLDERLEFLDSAPTGKRLWRALDENRQALQEYRQDLYQAYETNPGSAWLSREGLQAIDAAEKSTREALLREDVWGPAAAQAQREYNEPFHGKWFPSRKTVVGKLHFEQMKNAEGFAVYRGDPAAVRKFLARDLSEPDGARLAEQFSEYLDGAEAIARAGSKDSPKASRDALEAIRRLRKAQANAAQVTQAVQRTTRRTGVVDVGMQVAGGVAGAVTAGPGGAALGAMAMRGARIGDWMTRAGRKLGWASGKPLDMAALLGKGALAEAPAADLSTKLADDIFDGPFRKATPPPLPDAGPIQPNEIRRVGVMEPRPPADRAGVGPVRLDPRGQAVQARGVDAIQPQGQRAVGEVDEYTDVEPEPGGVGTLPPPDFNGRALADTEPAPRGGARTPVDDLGPEGTPVDGLDTFDTGDEFIPDVETARVREGGRNAGLHYEQVMAPGARARELSDRRTAALAEEFAISKPQFDELVDNLRSVDAKNDEGIGLADLLEGSEDELTEAGFIESATAKTGPPSPQARAVEAVQGIHPAIRVKNPDRIGEHLVNVFGEPPTTEQWKKLMPLDALQKLGRLGEGTGQPNPQVLARLKELSTPDDVAKYIDDATNGRVVIQSFDDQVCISAYGPLGPAAPFERRLPDGSVESDPGGLYDYSWKISRTFEKDAEGELTVHHDFFFVRDDLQSSGVGLEVLKNQIGEYSKMGVKHVRVDAAEVGKYFWPSIGFNRPEAVPAAVRAYQEFLVRNGHVESVEAARAATRGIKSLPSLANAEFGKEFLLQVPGNWNSDLHVRLDDNNPLFHLMRQRLGLGESALLAGMAFAGWMEGSPDNENEAGHAAAAATPAGLFAAQAALFKSVRGRVVAQAARRLFSATADALPRVTARLVYSRSQIEERQREFQTWQANPQELVDRVAEGFRDVPPEHSGTVAGGVFRTATFLKEKLPSVTKTNAMSIRQIPVSTEAMAKYARYEQAALNPREAVSEAAESKHLSTELLETLQALYPDLLAELRVQAYLQVREAGPPTTIQGRANYAQLFDGDGSMADPAFSVDVARMTAYAYEQAVPTKPPAPGGTPGVSRQATAVAMPAPGAV